jgi:DNA mismatch endonuclease (patch repair protein)
MVDVLTKRQRSYNMSRIRGANTTPELILRSLLYAGGCRGYRLHYRLLGKPDIVFTGKKVAVFIDGCFWHRCLKDFVRPATRRAFWDRKIAGNVKRDKEVNHRLAKQGWLVLRFWEHEVRKEPEKCCKAIVRTLRKRKGE